MVQENNLQKNNFYSTVGEVVYLNIKQKFRKINIKDLNGDIIDLVLW